MLVLFFFSVQYSAHESVRYGEQHSEEVIVKFTFGNNILKEGTLHKHGLQCL